MDPCHFRPRGVIVGSVAIVVLTILFAQTSLGGTTPAVFSNSPSEHAVALSFGDQQLDGARQSRSPSVAEDPLVSSGPTDAYRWDLLAPTGAVVPGVREGGAMAWDAADGYVLLFGGSITTGYAGVQATTWTYLNGTWTNITSTTAGQPPALLLASLTEDPQTGNMILYGGENVSQDTQNQTWSYHDHVWRNITASVGTPPEGEVLVQLVTDTTDDEIVAMGGANANGSAVFNGTWLFKGGRWINDTADATGFDVNPFLPTLSNDPAEHGVLAIVTGFGTAAYTGPRSTYTYAFAAGVWKNLTGSAGSEPPGTYSEFAAAGWLPVASAVTYYEGIIVTSVGNMIATSAQWTFSNGSWENNTASAGGPGVLILESGTVTGSDGVMILYGGTNLEGLQQSTWVFSAPPSVTATASARVVDTGQTVRLSGTVAGGLDPNTFGWSFGDGSSGSNLSSSHAYADPGVYLANFTATNLLGASSTASAVVIVNGAPSVTIVASPPAPSAGSTVGLFASVLGGSAPYTYSWNLGDGSLSAGPSVTHQYVSAGTYVATVTITDTTGTSANGSATITVVSASPTAVSLTSGTGLALLATVIALLAVVALLGVLLARRGRGPRSPPTRYAGPAAPPAAPSPPPGTGAPPPGATDAASPGPPVWKE